MQSGSRKQVDVARLKSDLTSASVELLSAHCATDRVRLQYSHQDIVAFGDPAALQKAITSAGAVYRFFSQIEVHLKQREGSKR